ncbi:FHA domain-containing protein [Porphyromonas levii]|uniref:FHA domain-containing protein n=1 Tax=Porphyromonas levii TaxID=28114 RepID=A0A4Y8WS43_9PORP|nr:FHA domain-containing protein [Porphyromonas levii]MBR8703250.1 hypothetical protein [Porphyromonas levii]MBR8712349.1 hypothetical protein [Porphyromonas levii]MBR8714184.1 hypothetical protein [Porphyromonas levii]MBR8726726.1 hypothetical protein [Porphyromonas levii]MBR8728789.1 hypothetical protein [Porphyromonas levii]
MKYEVSCPYCGATLVGSMPKDSAGSLRIICDECKQPVVVYQTAAEALQHRERGVKSVSIEGAQFDKETTYLEIIETEFTKPQNLRIPEGKSLFGRFNPKSTAQLQVLTADPSIDRQHAYFMLNKKGKLEVMDNDSMTGTFVNGGEIGKGERRRLASGDVLTFGATTAIVHLAGEEANEDEADYFLGL